MASSQLSSSIVDQSTAATLIAKDSPLDLSGLPPVFVSLSGFQIDAAGDLEDRLRHHGANLTWDVNEARIFLVNVERKRRALFDLRGQGLVLQESQLPHTWVKVEANSKRRRVDAAHATSVSNASTDSGTETEDESGDDAASTSPQTESTADVVDPVLECLLRSTIKVVKAAWIESCMTMGVLQPLGDNVLIEGVRVVDQIQSPVSPKPPITPKREASFGFRKPAVRESPDAILERAKADNLQTSPRRFRDFGARRFGDGNHSLSTAPYAAGAPTTQRPIDFLAQTTSEYEGDVPDSQLPPQPDWVLNHVLYACQRPTPDIKVNEEFLNLLKDIRLARLLTADEIGVRAYSTSIASIAAYPHKFTSAKEVAQLPGCDVKIANLWVEYHNNGDLVAAKSAKDDPELIVLRLFFDIWGVGATSAREFYYERGWRDLDDVVEFGWSTLSRVQQIGVKFYEQFKDPIPRAEVESIASIIHNHAVKVRDNRVQSLLVGGYRRGKTDSGDVDLLVSHPDEAATKDLVTDIVTSLEEEGWITHTLLLALTSTHREQQTLPFRASRGRDGAGFDTLDKALVVWQDPSWPTRHADLEKDAQAKNPAPHRRVDIIVSPWRTVGCAVAGWSGGTTFQRDLRRYAKNVKVWKFDSSGIRDRATGMVVDVEGYYGEAGTEHADGGRGVKGLGKWKDRAKTMEEAEQRVFEGMGLEWRPPSERCTG